MSAPATVKLEKKKTMQQRAARFASGGFISERVVPLVPELAQGGKPSDCLAEIVRSKFTGSVTVRYRWASKITVYGKWYYRDDAKGRAATTYRTHAHLWQCGFGPGAEYRIAEPLGLVADENFFLMRQVEGVSLADLIATGTLEKAVEAARAAARWLLKLHTTEMLFLEADPPCERIHVLKLADLLAKVIAECPDQAELFLDLLRQLRAIAPGMNDPPTLVPTHDQYRPAHILVAADHLVVIDLDRIRLSDPAKDVARFIHLLKKSLFEQCADTARASQIADHFLAEYRALAPANLQNLAYFRALYAFKALAKLAKSGKTDEPTRRSISELYLAEFDHVMEEARRGQMAFTAEVFGREWT